MIHLDAINKSFDLRYQRDDFSLKEAFVTLLRRSFHWIKYIDHLNPPLYITYENKIEDDQLGVAHVLKNISFTIELVVPDLLGSSKQWYSSTYYQGKTCLILLPHEYNKINSSTLNHYLGPPDLQHIINNFIIICYNFNIASKLPNWN